MKKLKVDDEICSCGHSKGYHTSHHLDNHGDKCEKCKCSRYTWKDFIVYKIVK